MNPFLNSSTGTAGELGERKLISAIRDWLGNASPPSPEGIGDDCAAFDLVPGQRGLVTTDPILWKRHFDEKIAPELAAAKLVKRNLSDIAAMGGKPVAAVVSLLLPANTSLAWLESFYAGLRDTALRYRLPIAGGDVSETDGLLGASLTLIGESVHSRILRRDTASPGDRIFVTGALGGSLLGHHVSFEPRLNEGQWLAARSEISAAIDLSDGLAKDLPALLPENAIAHLFAENIPVSVDAEKAASGSGHPALAHALSDGEDYELLFTVDKNTDADDFLADWQNAFPDVPLALIGEIRPAEPNFPPHRISGLPAELLNGLSGYEHLR